MKAGGKQRTQRKPQLRVIGKVPVLRRELDCPACGSEIESWAGDRENKCSWCGYRIVHQCRSIQ